MTLIDAPVSGGVRGAVEGTLTVMVGGRAADLDACRPLLEVLGHSVQHVGETGAGHALKALNNLLSATSLLATSEALLTGGRFGIDPEVMLATINGSTGRSYSTEYKWPTFVLARDVLVWLFAAADGQGHAHRGGARGSDGVAAHAGALGARALGAGAGDASGGRRPHRDRPLAGHARRCGADGPTAERGTVTESERIVRSFFATLSSGDLEALGSFFDDRSTWTICARDIAGAGTHTGRDAIIEGFLRPVRGLFEPGQPSVEVTRVIGEGPVVAVEATGRGRL